MNRLLALALLAFTPLPAEDWKSLPPARVSEADIAATESHEGLVLARYGDRDLALDLFRPKHSTKPLPAVVCIHGGAWWKGERKNFAHVARALAARGYVAATVSYRLSGEATFPAQIHDTKAAVRWLRANADTYGIDPDRIGATGSSAGGHLAALLGTSAGVPELEGEGGNADFSSAVQAVVPMGAQSDLMTERIARRSVDPAAAFYPQFLGGTQDEVPDTYRLASPRHHLDAGDPPFLFLTGELDDPSTHADEFRKQAEKLGIDAGLFVLEGAPHPFPSKQPFFDIAIDQLDAFFAVHLKKENQG